MVRDGVNGRLVPPGEPRQLAAAIDALLENPALAKALAGEGRAGVDAYDWAAVAGRLRQVYERAIG